MMLACREGHDHVVKTLLKAQANADAQSEVSCMLSIYILLYQVHIIITFYYVYHYYPCIHLYKMIVAVFQGGISALMVAIYLSFSPVIEVLIGAKPNVNLQDQVRNL